MADRTERRARPFLAEHPFLRYFLPLVVVTTLAVLAGVWISADRRADRWQTDFEAEQFGDIAGIGQTFTQPIVQASGDLAILVQQSAFSEMSLDPTTDELERVASIFTGLSGVRQYYDQVRLIDNDGLERVRVDLREGAPFRVEDLQDKSGRYYFDRSVVLGPGAIYISPLDLNVENGEIEQPLKPMLRLASPVFTAEGEQLGVVVLNYLGEVALEALRVDARSVQSTFYLANEAGFWLAAPDAADEWGFMLDQPDATLAVADPDAWATMNAQPVGQFSTALGLYSFRHVSPIDEITPFLPTVVADEEQWTAYSFVPIATLNAERNDIARETLWLGLAGLLALWALSAVAAVALARQWKNRFAAQQAEFVFNESMEGIAVADASRSVVAVNPAYTEITGYSEDDALGAIFPALESPLESERFYQELHGRLEADGRWQGRIMSERSDGNPMVQSVSLSLIRDDQGRPERYVGVITDATEVARRERELVEQATHDQLTSLANRTLVEEQLAQALAGWRRSDGSVAVCFIDLDGFKDVNDTLGHEAGDAVLRAAATRLTESTRDTDTIGRFGGDEFVVVMVDAGTLADVERCAERILESVRAPIDTAAGPARVRCSIGIVHVADGGNADPVQLLRLADEAMYEAKRSGGNRFQHAVVDPMSAPTPS